MTLRAAGLLALCALSAGAAHAADPADASFRSPFDLHLGVDEQHYYEEHFERMPYVFDNAVFLFKGDEFSVTVGPCDAAPCPVRYAPQAVTGNVHLKFSQEADKQGRLMMVLVVENKTGKTLKMEGLMTIPGKKGIFNTSLLPVRVGLTNYESWPHAIVQLVLKSIQTE